MNVLQIIDEQIQHISFLVVLYVQNDYVCLPNCQLLLVSTAYPTWANDPPTADPRKTYLPYFMSYIHMYVIYVCFWITNSLNENLYRISMYERSANNQ